MDRQADRGGPGERNKREEGGQRRRPVWSLAGRDRSPGCPPSEPQPQHAAVARSGEHVAFSRWPGPPPSLPLLLPLPARSPRAFVQGLHLPTPPPAGSRRTRAPRGSGRTSEAGKWVGAACIVPACCQPPSPTGSRRRVADVREDKGRHGPHQPPVTDGLCPHG